MIRCATALHAGSAFVGLCRTQETTSRVEPAQEYANYSVEFANKASASSPYSLPNARAGSLLRTHISCQGGAGSRVFAWTLCIASGHAAQARDTSVISLQPFGRTPALQVTGLHNS